MPSHHRLCYNLAGSIALAAFAASMASAEAADVSVTDAKIAGGKLVIAGTTSSPNTWVRLDGQAGSGYNVKSGADGAFSFGIVYHPGDCIVELQKVVSPTTVGEATEALVADCGPAGLTPRGAWSAKAAYATNDLVTSDGSTYRAKRSNSGKQPGAAVDWEVFAAAGADAEGADATTETASAGGNPSQRVAPTGPAGGDLTGNYPNPQIKDLAVTTAKIALGAVGTGRLHDDAVTDVKIRDGAVTAPKINPSAFFAGDISLDGGSVYQVTTGGIDSSDLAAGAVIGSKLGTITRVDAASAVIPAGGNGSVQATCPAGSRIIAGGNDGFFDLFVVASRDSGNGWAVFAHNASGGNRTLTTHAYCLL